MTLAGANTTEEQCVAGVGTSMIADCAQTRRSFAGARLRISSPRTRLVALGPVRGIRLAEADCPLEPAEVVQRPLGPMLLPMRMPNGVLTRKKLLRITMRVNRSQTTNYVPPESGTLEARVEWRLTFVRVNS